MYDQERQSKAIQCLTKYLQYFKSYFSVTFSVIECHCFPNKFGHLQLQNATQKVTNKKFDITFEESPFSLWIGENHKSYIDRFYMRIVEFLEFRLNIFKGPDADQKLSSIINNFIASLHKFFKNLSLQKKQKDRQKVIIGQVFCEIQEFVKKLVHFTFDHLEKISQKNSIILEEIKFSRKIINEHVLAPFHLTLSQLYKDQQTDNNFDERGQKYLISKIHTGAPQSRSKSDIRIENFYSVGSKSLRQSKIGNFNTQINLRKYQINTSELQRGQNVPKKPTYSQLLSIMDIDDLQVYSRDYIMEDLQNKNAKNKQMIKKYMKVYQRKQRKHKNRLLQSLQIKQNHLFEETEKKDLVLNFSTKSRSNLNVAIQTDKISMLKDDPIYSDNSTQINPKKRQKLSKPLTQGNNSNAVYLLQEKKGPKSKSENIRQQIMKNPIVNQNPQFERNRQTFAYKQKEKLYFQSLKNKLNFQNQQITRNFETRRQQSDTLRKMNKISAPSIIENTPNDYRKMFRNNIKKNGVKGSSFLSNKTQEKIKPSNSDIFSKNQLQLNTLDSNLVSLQGSSLCKRMPKRGKLMKFLQNEDMINSATMAEINKASDIKIKVQNQSYVQPQSSVLVLPRISSNQKHFSTQK